MKKAIKKVMKNNNLAKSNELMKSKLVNEDTKVSARIVGNNDDTKICVKEAPAK